MCGRATLRIVLSSPCMMFASMIEIVIMTRFGTGVNASPLMDRPQCQTTRRIGGLLFLTCAASEDGLTARSSYVFLPEGRSPLRSRAARAEHLAGRAEHHPGRDRIRARRMPCRR